MFDKRMPTLFLNWTRKGKPEGTPDCLLMGVVDFRVGLKHNTFFQAKNHHKKRPQTPPESVPNAAVTRGRPPCRCAGASCWPVRLWCPRSTNRSGVLFTSFTAVDIVCGRCHGTGCGRNRQLHGQRGTGDFFVRHLGLCLLLTTTTPYSVVFMVLCWSWAAHLCH